jgi:hypothetical protein
LAELPPLQQHPGIRSWMADHQQAVFTGRAPEGLNKFKQSTHNNYNNTILTTGFMLFKTQSSYLPGLIEDWWASVDNPTLLGKLGEPLSIYRTEWSHEQRVMQDYLWQSAKHGKQIAVANHVLDFNTPKGIYSSHYTDKLFSAAEGEFLRNSSTTYDYIAI